MRIRLAALALGVLATSGAAAEMRIAYNPYANVDWQTTQRLLAQTHDHTGNSLIVRYRDAGYDVIPYGNYSGDPDKAYSWSELRWPPQGWLLPNTIAAVSDVLLYTGVEQIFGNHVTTMFLSTYIERWYPALGTPKQAHHYETAQEKVDLVNGFGGIAIDAHPEVTPPDGVVAQEVYNALFRISYLEGTRAEDWNEAAFLPIWDAALSEGRLLWGVAVNDHYGPGASNTTLLAEIDSGKTVLLAPSLGEAEVRSAFDDGRLFAVRDLGLTKGLWPWIGSISVDGTAVTISTTDSVRWISMAEEVATGPTFDVTALSPRATYLRAEVENGDGSVVYVQPFRLRYVSKWSCGAGPELAVLLPLLWAWRSRRVMRRPAT